MCNNCVSFYPSLFLFVILIRIIKNGQTALHFAKSVDMAKLLVENKGDPLAKDEVRIQSLHSFVVFIYMVLCFRVGVLLLTLPRVTND